MKISVWGNTRGSTTKNIDEINDWSNNTSTVCQIVARNPHLTLTSPLTAFILLPIKPRHQTLLIAGIKRLCG